MNKRVKAALFAALLAALWLLVPSPALMGEIGVTPYGFGTALAALLAVALLQGLRMAEIRKRYAQVGDGPIGVIHRIGALDYALWCIPAALLLARLGYCLSRFSFFFVEMGPVSVLRLHEGGFMLYGAAAGALLAASALARKKGTSIAAALDEIAAPGLLAVAICRLFEWTTTEGVGAWVEYDWQMRFPISVMNEYGEWQLAVFLMEAAAAVVILMIALREKQGRGERIMTALLLYAACQVVFESLRMDGCLKLGFVRISQVISAVVILAVTVIRAQRCGGRKAAFARGAIVLACVAVVGVIEWALDKTPVSNVLLYAAMTAACAVFAFNGMWFAYRQKRTA